MWKALLNKSVREVRFVLKSAPEHHGAYKFLETRLSEIRMLNPNTFFSVESISDELKTDSAVHFVYGDTNNTEDEVKTAGLSVLEFEKVFMEKVKVGVTLSASVTPPKDNSERDLPVDIVETNKYVSRLDDSF